MLGRVDPLPFYGIPAKTAPRLHFLVILKIAECQRRRRCKAARRPFFARNCFPNLLGMLRKLVQTKMASFQ